MEITDDIRRSPAYAQYYYSQMEKSQDDASKAQDLRLRKKWMEDNRESELGVKPQLGIPSVDPRYQTKPGTGFYAEGVDPMRAFMAERNFERGASGLGGMSVQGLQGSGAMQDSVNSGINSLNLAKYNKRNPAQTELPTEYRLYQLAQQEGYVGSFMDYREAGKSKLIGDVTIGGESDFKVPTGYMRNPENAMSVVPIPGGDKDPANPQNVFKETQSYLSDRVSVDNFEYALDDYIAGIEAYGADMTPTRLGGNAGEMKAIHTDLLMMAKDLYELGALQAPDIALLEKLLPDSTSLKGALEGKKSALDALKILKDAVGRKGDVLKTKYPFAQHEKYKKEEREPRQFGSEIPPPPPGYIIDPNNPLRAVPDPNYRG